MQVEESQIRNLKNKVIDYIHKTATPRTIIRFAQICKIHIPKQLRDRYLEEK